MSLQVVKRIAMAASRWRWVGDGGAVLLQGMQMQVPMVARCYGWMPVQVAKRIVMVRSRWRWVADGGAVLLVNAIAVVDIL